MDDERSVLDGTDESPRPTELIEREAEPTPGPWFVHNPTGWLPSAWGFMNFWQMDYDPIAAGNSALVEACVAAYAQTIAMCPGDHWRALPNGGRERVTTSALSRLLKQFNDYQSRSDFIYNLVRQLYLTGNAYALAERNDRFEVSALHLFDPSQSRPLVSPNGEIFYQLGGNNVMEGRLRAQNYLPVEGAYWGVFPARNVLHPRLEAKVDEPLVGIPPLRHAEIAVMAQNAIGQTLLAFYANQSRPSGVLQTDLQLTTAQVVELRDRWNEQAKGLNAGGTPILTNGLKFQGISTSAKDSNLPETMKMTSNEICMVYGVPPAILGIEQAPFASTELLMQFWLARGLGFAINHVEVAFDQFFGLRGYPEEFVEFDTRALLRSAFKDRIEGLAKGVISGIFAPNEARAEEFLPAAKDGDEPRVQQQVVPLSAWSQPPPQTPAPEAPPPAAGPDGGGEEGGEALDEDEKTALELFRFRRAITLAGAEPPQVVEPAADVLALRQDLVNLGREARREAA